jgi:hypothetical protein
MLTVSRNKKEHIWQSEGCGDIFGFVKRTICRGEKYLKNSVFWDVTPFFIVTAVKTANLTQKNICALLPSPNFPVVILPNPP